MHIPVLAGPALDWLRIRGGGIYVDCTAGGGGHAARMAEQLHQLHLAGFPRGQLIALDRDMAAVEQTREHLAAYPNATVHHRNYAKLTQLLSELHVPSVDGILFDLGLSSMQLDDPRRGFSFQEDGPLDMRQNAATGLTAAELIGTLDRNALARLLYEYGDVKHNRRIADAIVRRRDAGSLKTTRDLAAAVADALPFVAGVPEETRTAFQAIRIAVNDELHCIEAGLGQAIEALAPEGRLVVISFHSGEDRMVKNVLRDAGKPRRECFADGRVRRVIPPLVRVLTSKPVTASPDEVRANPRAHSAKLRAAERLSIQGGP